MPIRILLADDHPIVRRGLRYVLEQLPDVELLAEAEDGLRALQLAERLRPDVLVLDLLLPGLNGWEVTREVTRRSPRTRVLILSMYDDEDYVTKAIQAGAHAYVLKESAVEDLVRALRKVAAGERYFSAPIAEAAHRASLEKDGRPDPQEALTARERQVLQLTVEGLSSAEAAERLHISPRTVETHRANLLRKLAVRNLKELIRLAVERGLVPRPPRTPDETSDGNP
jgi:two-component system response regulator NreC